MFVVESDVEVKIQDRMAQLLDDHDMKLWVQRAFKNVSCYRIENFDRISNKLIKARVAIKTDVLPANERALLESRPNDLTALRGFVERQFEAKGVCKTIGEPALRDT